VRYDQYLAQAEKIMALVDEAPSGPFTLERRWILKRITRSLAQFVGYAESEFQQSFDVGYEEGYAEADKEAQGEIESLRNRITDLENELEDTEEVDRAFAEGFEVGQRHSDGVESIELS
jgi:flagellar biosynthesis/type III secretory pathway protein FliH